MGLKTWMTGVGRGLRAFTGRMADDARGNIAMMFGLSMPILVLMTVGGVDIHRASTVRVNLQDALDAAALAAARSSYTTNAGIQDVGLASLRANLKAYPNATLREADTTFVLNSANVVVANAKVDVKTLVANIVLPPYGKFMDDTLPVGAHSEVNRSSRNLEVALVLDVTGSMRGTKLEDLKAAAADLVEMVVQPLQTPFYSRMAIVPYSVGVNLGSRAAAARGTPTGAAAISNISWHKGSTFRVTAATKANPIVLTTSTNHGLTVGDKVAFWDVGGMTALNGVVYTVGSVPSSKKLSLKNAAGNSNIDSRSWSSFSGSTAYVAECTRTDCKPTVTAASHSLPNPAGTVYLNGIGGMTQLNNTGFTTTYIDPNSYLLDTVGARTYTSGGSSFCGQNGCQWRVYRNILNAIKWIETGNCVSERTGTNAYTDVSPSTSKVAFNYAASGNTCTDKVLQPLTDSKPILLNLIGDLAVSGSTAGQIGTAWGWYAVSPDFNGLWSSNTSGAYNSATLLKAVIIMTDGEFNTNHCQGVLATDASYGGNDRIGNCNATNGDPFVQTRLLCEAMEAKGILIYTVGFQMNANGVGAQTLNACATSGSAFLPASGADLTEAFKAIGRDITRLKISR